MSRFGLLLVIALLLATTPVRVFAAADPMALLREAKAASGGNAWDGVRTLHVTADVQDEGLKGTKEEWDDLLLGRYTVATKLGPASGASGFDGTRRWKHNASGQVQIEDSAATLIDEANRTYRISHAFWFPARHAARLTSKAPVTQDGGTFDIVEIMPKGGRPFEFWISHKTHLIERMIEHAAFYTVNEEYSGWRKVSGIVLPTVVEATVMSPRGQLLETKRETIRHVDVNPSIPVNAFIPPASAVDYTFPKGMDSVSLPFDLANNHIYVRARINGQLVHLMFDTGATGILDSVIAAKLGLPVEGQTSAMGVGTGVDHGGYVRLKTLDVGGLTLRNQIFTTSDQSTFRNVEGYPADGVVGLELPHRVIVQLNYITQRMILSRADKFAPPAGFEQIPFKFLLQIPVIDANVDGLRGKFAIDTGNRASLILLGQLAGEKEKGSGPILRKALIGWGIGGAAYGDVIRTRTLKLGSFTIGRPVTILLPQGPPVDGNIGGGILKRFDVVLDYPHEKLWLKKNANAALPDIYDRAGIWLNRDGAALQVMRVLPRSPAAKAGIEAGDRITTFDGKPAAIMSLPEIRGRLKGLPGTTISMGVLRDGKRVTLKLVLTNLI